jgi:hypothetical protein
METSSNDLGQNLEEVLEHQGEPFGYKLLHPKGYLAIRHYSLLGKKTKG